MKRCHPLWIALAAFGLALVVHAQTVVQRPVSPDHVTFYTEPNFKGDALTVEAGAAVASLDTMRRPNQRPWTFAISSVRVSGAAKAVVYTGVEFSGERLEIAGDISDLYAARRPGSARGTWDRSIASLSVIGPPRAVVPAPIPYPPPPQTIYVTPPPAPPPVIHERRPAYSRSQAEAMITRAYLDVLDRRPDPNGLRHYREILLRDGWSERQLIQDLQRSAEARAVNPDQAIAKLYREVLGREPDPHGLAHYRQKWREGWTRNAIREDLRHSKEGRDVAIRNAINRAYRDILGREPDASGFATYERLMREKHLSERDLRDALARSDEARARKSGRR